MTTALSPATALAVARPDVEPILLAEIEFTVPTALTLRLSDAPRIELGQEWLGLVQSWGTLEERLNPLDPGGAPATAEITLFNTRPVAGRDRFSDLIRTTFNTVGAYEFRGAKVTFKRLDAGLVLGDEEILGTFYLEEPTEIDERLRLRMSDVTLLFENAIGLTTISQAEFPNAAAAGIGKTIPRVIGSVKQMKAVPIIDGQADRLSADLTAVATSLTLVDASLFPTAATILIDTEESTYTGKSGSTLTGLTRGVNGTTAALHGAQTTVFELRSTYVFAVSEHDARFRTKNVSSLRVDGYPVRSSVAVNLDNAGVVAGKRFTTITFTPSSVGSFHTIPFGEFPIIVAAISASVPNGGDANASRTVTTPDAERLGHPHDRSVSWTCTVGGASPAAVSWAVSRRQTGGAFVEIGRGLGANGAGSDTRHYSSGADDEIRLDISLPAATAGNATLTFNSYTVSASSGDAASTASAVIGEVTCDVDGVQDDSSGSLTGVGSQMLENPTDVAMYVHRALLPRITTENLGRQWPITRGKTAPLKWAFALGANGAVRYSDLRRTFGEQARCQLYTEGGLIEWRYLEDAPGADFVLEYGRDVWEDAPARASRTDRTRVITRLVASAQRTYSGDREPRYVKPVGPDPGDDAIESQVAYGLIQDQATADAIATYWQRVWRRQRWQVELVGWQNLLPYEKGQCFAISGHPILEAHGGANLVFRIIGKAYLLSDDNPARIRLSGVEANP